jgi:hypothetical protein
MFWTDVARAVPDLATKVQERFEAHGLALIATLRKDGSPRISGVETAFGEGDMWMGMMPVSLKAKDLLRDPRCALHSATADKDVKEGDAKIAGRAVPVDDERVYARYIKATGGSDAPPLGGFHLFRLDLREMSHLIPDGDHLDIRMWSEERGYKQVDRF